MIPAGPAPTIDPVARVVAFYESLDAEALERLATVYTEEAYFRDPFNEVHDCAAINRIFRHMFDNLDQVGFTFLDRVVALPSATLTWDMRFRVRRWHSGGVLTVHGASVLRFAPDGRVCYHRDYWDTGEELYAKLPVIGAGIRFLRRRLA